MPNYECVPPFTQSGLIFNIPACCVLQGLAISSFYRSSDGLAAGLDFTDFTFLDKEFQKIVKDMELPEALSGQFKDEIHKFEGLKMPYATSAERLAEKQGILDIFSDTKFRNDALSLKNKIREIKEPDKLTEIAGHIFTAENLDDVRKVLEN